MSAPDSEAINRPPVVPSVTQTTPAPETKDPLKDVDKDMGRVLTALAGLGGKPIETLTPEQARQQPTPADAVKAVLKEDGKPVTPEAVAKVQDRTIPAGTGALPVRIYTPIGVAGPAPVIVYYHGGGFVIASNDVYDATPRALANGAKAIVVSVEYRKAPEHKFPAAHDDAFAAYRWVVKNAGSIGGDPRRLAVAGESAGGNLAENVAIAARDQHERQPLHVLLVYPVASSNMSSQSYSDNRDAKPLNKSMMAWFTDKYFRTPADAQDPRINLVAAKLQGLPPTTIINAAIDPLLSDGEELAKKLEAAEVSVEQKTYKGVTHEFFGMGAVVADAKDAVDYAAGRIKTSFEKAATRQTNTDLTN
ncbi:MAG TPA: alpha/beta hydrolase fold domain-containing protein [Polyangiaceae bacterium]|nr:alpha/beta hydrolase fold domain-containing protein [Polyangiaceae bacterium]